MSALYVCLSRNSVLRHNYPYKMENKKGNDFKIT